MDLKACTITVTREEMLSWNRNDVIKGGKNNQIISPLLLFLNITEYIHGGLPGCVCTHSI